MIEDSFIDDEGYLVSADPHHGHSMRIRKATEQDEVRQVLTEYIETIPGILEQLADRLGLYGWCGEDLCKQHPQGGYYCCRASFVEDMQQRLEEAQQIDNVLNNHKRIEEMLKWFNKNQHSLQEKKGP